MLTGRARVAFAINQRSRPGSVFLRSAGKLLTTVSPPSLLLRQLFEKESSTYTYLIADALNKEAILIDPVIETAERDMQIVKDLELNLKYVINTHVHADHITGTGKLKALSREFKGADFDICKSAISAASNAAADILLQDGDKLHFGSRYLQVLATPGHTEGCVSYLLDDWSMVFTGDALLIRGCGRTDFQGGSSDALYESVHTKLFGALPGAYIVYPAHDYLGRPCSTILEEQSLNPRLTKSKDEFRVIMQELNLPYPKKIDSAVPANLLCGAFDFMISQCEPKAVICTAEYRM